MSELNFDLLKRLCETPSRCGHAPDLSAEQQSEDKTRGDRTARLPQKTQGLRATSRRNVCRASDGSLQSASAFHSQPGTAGSFSRARRSATN